MEFFYLKFLFFQGNADTSDSHHAAQITFTDAYSALRALEANGGQLVWKDNTLSLTPMPTPSPRATAAAAVTTAPLSSSWPHRLVKRQSSAPGAKFRSPRAAASLVSGSAVAVASSSSHHPPLHRIVSHRDQDVKSSHVGENNAADHQNIFNLSRYGWPFLG